MAERAQIDPKFSGLLGDLTDLEKVQAAKDVAATMATPGWARIVQLLESRRIQVLEELVAQVLVREQAEYASRLAEARALTAATDACRTVLGVGERSARQLSEAERTS